MGLKEFDIEKIEFNPFTKISKEWFLLSAGNESGFNMMTASWGAMGHIWKKNLFQTVVRPQRFTKEFVDKNDVFAISFFGEENRKALALCGSKSGRDIDKAKETGLIPVFTDGTVTFEQAEMVFICKKLYVQQMEKADFVDKSLLDNYANNDFHYAFYGEIIKAYKKD